MLQATSPVQSDGDKFKDGVPLQTHPHTVNLQLGNTIKPANATAIISSVGSPMIRNSVFIE